MTLETVERIEPARLENPSADIIDVIAELSASAAVLGKALHPMTAASLAGLVRIMNTYYPISLRDTTHGLATSKEPSLANWTRMKGGAIFRSRRQPMCACRPRSISCRRMGPFLLPPPATSCAGCT